MQDQNKQLVRLVVSAPIRGKLSLRRDYADGTHEVSGASVKMVYSALSGNGEKISAENLSKIAFCGGQMTLTLRQDPVDR